MDSLAGKLGSIPESAIKTIEEKGGDSLTSIANTLNNDILPLATALINPSIC